MLGEQITFLSFEDQIFKSAKSGFKEKYSKRKFNKAIFKLIQNKEKEYTKKVIDLNLKGIKDGKLEDINQTKNCCCL
jgi:hypothetical protein